MKFDLRRPVFDTLAIPMLRLLLLALLFPVLAQAQDKPAKRTCRVLFLNPPANAPKKLFLHDGVESQEIELPQMNFSDVYQIAAGDTSIRLLPTAVIKPEEIPADAPGAKIAASVVDCYIVVKEDPANKVVPVQFQIIDAGSEKFRKGQTMWFNLSKFSVGGQLGTQKLAMKSMSREITDAPATGKEAYEVNLSFLRPGDPVFHSISQTKWIHDPSSRMVIFFYGGSETSAPQFSGFKDFRLPPEKSE